MESRADRKSWQARMTELLLAALATTMLGGAGIIGFSFYRQETASAAQPAIPDGAPFSSWSDNGRSGKYLLQIFEGNGPAERVHTYGTIMTDTDCEADAQGFSHCHNEIQFPNGSRMTVINTHQMMQNPCLEPGKKLVLAKIAPNWVVASRSWM